MNIAKRSAQFGAAILIFALVVRLAAGSAASGGEELPFFPHRPTGAISLSGAPGQSSIPTLPAAATTAPTLPTTVATQPPLPQGIQFYASDTDYIKLRYATDCGVTAQLEPLLLSALTWQLDSGEPTVLIVHSHGTESFTREPGQDYRETSAYRTENDRYNMIAVGDALAALLQQRGICVLHDRQAHDAVNYNAAYTNSRRSVQEYLAQYPSIRIVLDLHRDSALNADGTQFATGAMVNGESSAQLMLLAGSDAVYGSHPNWQENLALALKLQVLLEKQAPGITRRTLLRGNVFNQDLCSGMLIVEVGACGNTLTQALRAMQPLAEAIAALANGANTA